MLYAILKSIRHIWVTVSRCSRALRMMSRRTFYVPELIVLNVCKHVFHGQARHVSLHALPEGVREEHWTQLVQAGDGRHLRDGCHSGFFPSDRTNSALKTFVVDHF